MKKITPWHYWASLLLICSNYLRTVMDSVSAYFLFIALLGMRAHSVSLQRWGFVALTMGLLAGGGALGSEVQSSASAGFPTQVFRFHIGKCHLDPKDSSVLSSGKPSVQIAYRHGGSEETWTSTTKTGADASFDIDVDLPLDSDPNAQVRISLVDVGTIWNNTLVEITFPAMKLRDVLGSGRLKHDLSWVDVGIVDRPGRYKVLLERTMVAVEDFEAIGGTLQTVTQSIRMENLIASPVNSFQRAAANLWQLISESLEKCDNLVVVEQNGKVIFDSSKVSTPPMPQGLAVLWSPRCEFVISWKPYDKITVRFQDHNSVTRNSTILEPTDNSTSSISLLQGPIHGGKQGRTIVLFTSQRLDG